MGLNLSPPRIGPVNGCLLYSSLRNNGPGFGRINYPKLTWSLPIKTEVSQALGIYGCEMSWVMAVWYQETDQLTHRPTPDQLDWSPRTAHHGQHTTTRHEPLDHILMKFPQCDIPRRHPKFVRWNLKSLDVFLRLRLDLAKRVPR